MNRRFLNQFLGSCTLLLGIPQLAVADPAAISRPRPNVLFICTDDMRPWLGCYKHPRAITPHMDALARRGVRFDSAHCQYALCMPSRTSLLSGLRPDEAGRQIYLSTGEGSLRDPNLSIRHLRPDIVTLPQYLRQQGWHTISIGKVGHDWDVPGWDEYRLGPDETYNEFDFYVLPESRAKITDQSQHLPPRGIPFEAADRADIEYNDAIIAADAVTTLQRLKSRGEPFFLAVGLFRPHMPLVCPKRYWDRYPAGQMVLASNLKQPADVGPLARFSGPAQADWEHYRFPEKEDGSVDEATMREMIRGYLACITFVDAQIGRILDELKAEGLDKNTIVVLWSDHGYHLGEHGEWSKVTNYEESTRAPLVIVDPAAPHAGRVVAQPVELLDLYPTLCDLLDLPKPEHLEGESLLPLLRGEPGRVKDCAVSIIVRSCDWLAGGLPRRDLIPEIDDAAGWSLRTARYRYTAWFDARTKQILQRELFDHDTDPGENKNLSGDPAHAAIMKELHEKLLREYIEPQRKATASPRPADTAAVFRLEADPVHARVPVLSWDTEGGDRAKMNLLRADTAVDLRIKMDGQWRGGESFATQVEKADGAETCYRLAFAPDAELSWRLQPSAGRLTMTFAAQGAGVSRVEGLELAFPFDPRATATTLIPKVWDDEGKLHLPAIISAPDFGQMLFRATPQADLKGRLTGGRASHTIDFTLELPVPQPGAAITLSLEPVRLPAPTGLQDQSLWRAVRRGWFNAFQPSAQWGDWGYCGRVFGAPAGILSNNVISDPVSCLIHLLADQALLTPSLPEGISASDLVRRTVDWWLDHRTKTTGEVIAYWDYADMLDTNPSLLISAWDYVEASGDRAWLARRIGRLEFIAQYLVKRDVDNDGLVESTHSGNYGTLIEPLRGGSAWDTINAGHKDAYCNALIYRAFRCLADLEKQLKRPEQQQHYTERADRLKAAYVKTFFNPATGWLAWWQSEDGEVHDLASPMISSLAICYGLVEPVQGWQILNRLWAKIEAVGFKRFDLGVPLTLVPVRRGDYLIGLDGPGVPKKEDGSDGFGYYLNGGCCVNDAVYFITALHIAGEHARGDRILRAMVDRQERGVFPNGGGFQNGVVNEGGRGAEFYTWDGQPTGYEGYHPYSFSFLQAILLREPSRRARLYRPLQ